MSEKEFWNSTTRKILLLYREHAEFNGWEVKDKEEKEQYIDEVSWL